MELINPEMAYTLVLVSTERLSHLLAFTDVALKSWYFYQHLTWQTAA